MTDGPHRARLAISPTATLPSWLWSLKIFPSLPGSRVTIFFCHASSPLLQLINQWLNFTYYSRSHVFRYGHRNKNSVLTRIELTISALLAGVRGYLLEGGIGQWQASLCDNAQHTSRSELEAPSVKEVDRQNVGGSILPGIIHY